MSKTKKSVAIVIPNWNGEEHLREGIESIRRQSVPVKLIVVDNGSVDSSKNILYSYPDIEVIELDKNYGFAGGVNPGIKKAMADGFKYVMLFNNDAIADEHAVENLLAKIEEDSIIGMVTCKFLSIDGKTLDSTGDIYSIWGLPYPRGRDSININQYDDQTEIFGASGGATLYRTALFEDIGLFDEDFFAYFEDVDLSFRAQLRGWKACFEPKARVYHHISSTGSKIKGFMTYQTFKNLPWLLFKNVPLSLMWKIYPRFAFSHITFFLSSIAKKQFYWSIKGTLVALYKMPKKLVQRHQIQSSRKITPNELMSKLYDDIPPNYKKLIKLRNSIVFWRKN